MKKVVLIIGTRPNFIKAFPVYKCLKTNFDLTLIHTQQHHDKCMSDIFFDQLNFPKPDIYLNIKTRTQAGQLSEMICQLESEFSKINPDLVVVFGDVTSTLAGAMTANKMNIKLAHVEAGLRSFDRTMPEEINRILTDELTDIYFCTEKSGVNNLKNKSNVYFVGNTMIDTLYEFKEMFQIMTTTDKYNLTKNEYVLITLHRQSNVDDLDKLKIIFDDLFKMSLKIKLVYPAHPRTISKLKQINYLDKLEESNILMLEPQGYLDFMNLLMNCKYVITDSGGIQEESSVLNIPCFTLRENTERPVTIINGTNKLINNFDEIELIDKKCNIELWDGKASRRILEILKLSL